MGLKSLKQKVILNFDHHHDPSDQDDGKMDDAAAATGDGRSHRSNDDSDTHRLVLLTLDKHKDGIWIRRLVERLREVTNPSTAAAASACTIIVEVRAIEQWLSKPWKVSSSNIGSNGDDDDDDDIFHDVIGIVNRVSDAAPPVLFKLCCAVLHSASTIRQIPVWNGPTSYGLCANKWCHHMIFEQAGLSSPYPTTFQFCSNNSDQASSLKIDKDLFPFGSNILVKPNAGGFGNGIERIRIRSDIKMNPSIATSSFDDGVVLLQRYIPPNNDRIYRVWFLNGKVQCAVERIVIEDDDDDHDSAQFTSGCASGLCSLPSRRSKDLSSPTEIHEDKSDGSRIPSNSMRAWKIPFDVQQEIELKLLPLLQDCHCGSVEFMYRQDTSINNDHHESTNKRLYFDLNMLSTLPVMVGDKTEKGSVFNEDMVWNEDYDPWSELAKAIVAFVQK